MRRIVHGLCAIKVFFMLASLIPIVCALAADGYEPGSPEEIVALLKDPQYAEVIVLTRDVALPDGRSVFIYSAEDNEKLLDLNGHILSCGENIDNQADLCVIDSAGGGVLELNGGSLINYGTLTIDGAEVAGNGVRSVLTNRWSGTFHLISGRIYGKKAPFIIENLGGKCIIDGGVISGDYDIAVVSKWGTELYPIYVYDEAGNVIAASTGARWHGGVLTINGGLIEGSTELWETDVTITGGTIRGRIWMPTYLNEKGERVVQDIPDALRCHNAAGELVTVPAPIYELRWENGEMKRSYWDVSPGDWFFEPVQELMDRGVLDYGKDGNFGPSEPLTRSQATALLARTCGLEPEAEMDNDPFCDVTINVPHAGYIYAAKRAGLISGYGDGRFCPDNTISRQEFAVLVDAAVGKNDMEESGEVCPVTFWDEGCIAPWAREAVARGVVCGLWRGTGDEGFAPQGIITRTEAAVVLVRLLENTGVGK